MAVALLVAVQCPQWLPAVAAVSLGVRWELGMALLGVAALYAAARIISSRQFGVGVLLAAALVGPFVWNNARSTGDPMYHSSVHATFYANIELTGGGHTDAGPLPMEERIDPDLSAPMYRAPLVSWGQYVEQ